MALIEMRPILSSLLDELEPGALSDDFVQKLRHIFPDTLILAAFDIVDRERVLKYKTEWGRTLYEVSGSTATYTVFLDLMSAQTTYCSCPSFVVSVLLSEDLLMCKHVLAVHISIRLAKCLERTVTDDDLPAILTRQLSLL